MQLRRYEVNRTSSASCCCRVTWKERCRLDAGLAILYVFGQNPARHRLNAAVVAVTSATSAEQIAVSSIGAYDVYKRYINPKASDKQILRADIISIGIYAIFMGVFGTIWCVSAILNYSRRLTRSGRCKGSTLGSAWAICEFTHESQRIGLT